MERAMRKAMNVTLLAVFLGISPAAALAEADGPDFFRVTGVAADDVLNIRDAANARASKIGEIPHDANGIRSLGCEGGLSFAAWEKATEAEREAAAKQRWCKVEYSGVSGWVAARFLTEGSAPATETDEPGFAWHLVGVGDGAAIGEGQIVFLPDGAVFGSTGCNRFNGNVVSARGMIGFNGPLATTRMACPGNLAQQEDAVIAALSGEVRVSFDPVTDQMLLESVNGAPALRFQRRH
jgi:heat shock protein HslJ